MDLQIGRGGGPRRSRTRAPTPGASSCRASFEFLAELLTFSTSRGANVWR